MSVRYETPKGKLFDDFKSVPEARRAVQASASACFGFVLLFLIALVMQDIHALDWVVDALWLSALWLLFSPRVVRAVVFLVCIGVTAVVYAYFLAKGAFFPGPADFVGLPVLLWGSINSWRATRYLEREQKRPFTHLGSPP